MLPIPTFLRRNTRFSEDFALKLHGKAFVILPVTPPPLVCVNTNKLVNSLIFFQLEERDRFRLPSVVCIKKAYKQFVFAVSDSIQLPLVHPFIHLSFIKKNKQFKALKFVKPPSKYDLFEIIFLRAIYL